MCDQLSQLDRSVDHLKDIFFIEYDTQLLVLYDNELEFITPVYGVWRSFFFFSSRRRHTRFDCDWSSDVCSSDLRHAEISWASSESEADTRGRGSANNGVESAAASVTVTGSASGVGPPSVGTR